MVQKKFSQALEDTISGAVQSLCFFLVDGSEGSFAELSKLPSSLLIKARIFSRRNALAIVANDLKNKKPIFKCCEKCLKAYLMKEAEKVENTDNIKKSLDNLLKCEVGHEGYYLDGKKLRKI